MLRTQIFINKTSVDLLEDISIPATYSIVDIREPEKRNTAYTKTVSLPGTATNNKLFSHIWNLGTVLNTSGVTTTNFNPNFNPNLKADVLVLIDGITTFKGYLQLNKISIDQTHYEYIYECTMFGNLANIFQTLGDSRLSEIDLSEYNHTYNKTNQVNSWNTSIIKNGGNFVNFSGGNPTGEGYVYPMIDYGFNNGTSYNVSEFFPAIYAKTIVDKIVGDAGFNFSPDFIGDTFFKRLVIPFGGDQLRLSETQVQNRTFRAQNNSTWNVAHDPSTSSGLQTTGNVAFQDETTSPNYDTGGVYNNSIYRFTPSVKGTYKITAEVSMNLTHFPTAGTVNYASNDRYDVFGLMYVLKNGFNALNTVGLGMLQGANANPNGPSSFYFDYRQATLTSGTTNCNLTVPIQWQGFLDPANNDYINIYLANVNGSQNGSPTTNDLYKGASGWTRVNVLTDSFFSASLVDTKIQEGDTVDMNNVLPDNIKQSDFLLSIIKMFNLYLDQDPNQTNKLIVDTRDNFYSSGTTKFWDTKLDYGKPQVKIPMGELEARTYVFKYKEDKDYYNELYDKKYLDNYGLKRFQIDNDFLKEEIKTELIFSPTPLADYVGIDRVIPKIFIVDSSGNVQPKPSNLRILYYGGVKTTNNPWSYVATSGTTQHTTYPYAGHLDDVANPTLDLNWSVPKEVFYTALKYTDNNLFNAYWKKSMQELTDPDSYIFQGWFRLTAQDIAGLDFRDTFYIDGQLFRLNKIYDYDPTQNELTLCEFVKLKLYQSYIPETRSGNGGVAGADEGFTSGEQMPGYNQQSTQLNNYVGSSSRIGQNNFIGQNTIGCEIVGGDRNVISDGCKFVNLINSSGTTVTSGVHNVTAINSSGTTISESDVVYINGAKFPTTYDKASYVYTPALTNTTNISASTAYPCQFMRVGNVVTVSGMVEIDTTLVGTYQLGISLPVASAFTQNYQCAGTGVGTNNSLDDPIYIRANVASGNALLIGSDNDITNHAHYFHFTYQIL